ncbi:hypothetical protein [Brevibacillus porteri]|uniref:Uncharacterized protein n=1 Tax=Brevibacillus porteri TaxID=2126350 RepID=A0ABX5FRI5_9BACL|nr:hypothetical protein [Brevibacillus porteri]MED1800488.1 hypothetical protein [Brevibacillus porteri]MED2132671.1 hypothetical protein [Brevibacillus porteri]MED2743320.1 hypothetical protein [Brevibacillus porteri]MED2816154.1 hypothetical protein [Brevibacillus porteri]MED2893996.1 hypothetical protein [Brevibacillus porteri]
MLKFVFLHVLVTVCYSLMQSHGRNKQMLIVRMLVAGFLPIFGLLLLAITDVYKRTSKKNVNELMLESDLLKLSEGSNIFRRTDMEKEMNIVPVEDILFLNDTSTRRKMLIDVLKEQTIWQIGTLETALQNEDSETVHYAAAALTEMRRNLQLQLQDLSVKYEENKQNLEVLRAYADVLKKYLDSPLIDQRTYVKYSYTYSFVLESLLDIYQEEESYFVDKINCELVNQSYEKAAQYCQLFHEYHPESEQPYVMSLKRFFTIRDHAGFAAEMNRLKGSAVKISHATLMMIRYWNTLEADEQDSTWKEVAAAQETGTNSKEMSDTK